MTKLQPDTNCNAVVTYNDGTEVPVYASKLVINNLNNFSDWQCNAGHSRIFILPDTSVYSGECENDYLGKLSDQSFQILPKMTTCKKTACYNNPDDLMVEKIRFVEQNNK
jgi:hypothetical protein